MYSRPDMPFLTCVPLIILSSVCVSHILRLCPVHTGCVFWIDMFPTYYEYQVQCQSSHSCLHIHALCTHGEWLGF